MKHPLDISAILSTVIGVASLATDVTFQHELSTVAGGHATGILAVLGGLGLIAGKVLGIIKTNQSDAAVAAGTYPAPAPTPAPITISFSTPKGS